MQVVSFKQQRLPNFVTFTNGLVFMWRHRVIHGKYVQGHFNDSSRWTVEEGFHDQYTGYFADPVAGVSLKAKATRYVKHLREKNECGELLIAGITCHVLTARAGSFVSATKIVPHSSAVVRYSGSVWTVANRAMSVPVTYRNAQKITCISSVYDSREFDDFPRYMATEFSILNVENPLIHDGQLFFWQQDNAAKGAPHLLRVVENNDAEIRTLLRFNHPLVVTDFDVSPDGRRLVICLENYVYSEHRKAREVRLYDLTRSGCNEVARFDISGYRCCFTSDGMTFAVVCTSAEFENSVDKVLFLDVE
jgi:hypothetical protein